MPRSATRYLALLALCVVAHVASVPGALATDALPGTGSVVTWQMPTPATFPAYANITLTVNATEVGGTIANVMFFYSVGSAGKIIGTVTSSSSTYSLVWPHVAPGTYSVGALALDTANVRRGAPPLTVTVGAGTPPPPPPPATYTLTVNGGAGAMGSGTYPGGTQVFITAGTPPSGQVFQHWNGPVANSFAPNTTVTMPAANVTVTAVFTTPAPIPQPVTSHPRLWVTQADLPRLQSWAVASNPIYQQGLGPVIAQAVTIYTTKFAPFYTATPPALPYPDPGDTQGYTGYLTEQYGLVLAFASLIATDPVIKVQYAQWARNMLMYAMNQAAQDHLTGAPFRDPLFAVYNRANGEGEGWPLIVDWIYPALSAQDKLTIRNVFMQWANDCLNAYTTGGDHPAPIGVTNSTILLPGGKPYRMAANNYYLGHARLLTMMALAIDAADDPPVNPSLPGPVLGNSLRSYLSDAVGAWLYQEYAMFGEPATIAADYGLVNNPSGAKLGIASGGLPPEGMLYGHSFAYILDQLLALHTAGFNNPALAGPQTKLIGAPVWDRFVNGFISSLVPAMQVFPGYVWLGPVYQMASYGDLLRLWITPDFVQPFALLTLLDRATGALDSTGQPLHSNAARWFATSALEGGAANLVQRMTNPWSLTEPILYFLLFDPTAPAPTDPRPTMPLIFTDVPAGRVLARTNWSPQATMFDYRGSWISINHQVGDAGQFELYRQGEWLTKEMSNYDNNALGMTTPYHNTLGLQNFALNGTPHNLNWFEGGEWANGSQWMLGASAGDPTTTTSTGPAYVFAHSDLTNLYNRPNIWTPADAALDITHASRSILWLNADYVVVYDRATSVHTGLFKRFHLNLVTAPTITGNIVTEVTPHGQRLFIQTLLPQNMTATVTHAAANLNPIAWLEPTQFQLAIEDPSKPVDVRFLHVLQGADPGAPMDTATLVQSMAGTAFDGAVFAHTAVFFVHDTHAAFTGTTLPLQTTPQTLFVTGLAPGTGYTVVTYSGYITITPGGSDATTDGAGVLRLVF